MSYYLIGYATIPASLTSCLRDYIPARDNETSVLRPVYRVSNLCYIPHLSATSCALIPQMPFFSTSTLSPGSTTFTMAASKPACPVPLMAIVRLFVVWNAYCRPALISSMIDRHSGWRWPTNGREATFRMRGGQLEGPGPHSRRSGTAMGFLSTSGGLYCGSISFFPDNVLFPRPRPVFCNY